MMARITLLPIDIHNSGEEEGEADDGQDNGNKWEDSGSDLAVGSVGGGGLVAGVGGGGAVGGGGGAVAGGGRRGGGGVRVAVRPVALGDLGGLGVGGAGHGKAKNGSLFEVHSVARFYVQVFRLVLIPLVVLWTLFLATDLFKDHCPGTECRST